MPTREPQDLCVEHAVAVDPLTGAAVISVPLRVTPARDGFEPHLGLSYSSSGTNSPYGLGWSLDGIVSVAVDLRRRYAAYDGTQGFRLAGVGEIAPALRPDGSDFVDHPPGFRVRRYVGRDHSGHLRIEQWTEQASGAVHWRTRDARNVLTIFGALDDGLGRIADPDEPRRVFTWLPEVQIDPVGNAIVFEYAAETLDGVDTATAFEQSRRPKPGRKLPQRYPKRIRYGNTVPLGPDGGMPAGVEWCFEVVFDYGDHPDGGGPASPSPSAPWPARPDPYSTFRAGFDLRTYRLCRRVLVFHRFDSLGPAPLAVAEYAFEYQPDPAGTTLAAIRYSRSRRDAASGAIARRTLPPLRFTYSKPTLGTAFEPASPDALRNTPAGLTGAYRWIDLYGEGIPGILAETGRGWYYKRNEGDGHFGAAELVSGQPAHRLADAVIRDFDADGNVDLVVQHGRLAGYYVHDRARGEWEAFRPFPALPHLEAAGRHAQWVDLDGDGRSDLLLADPDRPVWYASLGRQGFSAALDVDLPGGGGRDAPGMERTDLGLFFADMTGDGGAHQVRIGNGRVEFWPHLGHGRFAEPIVMEGAPEFDWAGDFHPDRLLLADLNGDGIADLIYLGRGEVRTWINAGGNRLIEGPTIRNGPMMDRLASAAVVDYAGDGTLSLVWSSALADPARPISILKLTDGIKPNLLLGVDDGMGAAFNLGYASSARHYLRDRREGQPWATRLPMHSTVVERLEAVDAIAGGRVVTRYAYHDGHYDGQEQVFRGFGRVDIDDAETHLSAAGEGDAHTVPSRRRLWHHLGTAPGASLAGAYAGDPLLQRIEVQTIEAPGPLGSQVYDDALRALAGRVIRQEAYALDAAGTPAEHPLEVVQFGYRIRLVNAPAAGRPAAFDVHEAESVRHVYEGSPADPRVSQSRAVDVDEYGQVRLGFTVAHARRPSIAPDAPAQSRPIVTARQTDYLNVDLADRHELGVVVQSRAFEISGLPADGVTLPAGSSDAAVVAAVAAAKPFNEPFAGGGVEARLTAWERNIYWNATLTGPAPVGAAGGPALLHHAERAAFNPTFAAAALPPGVNAAALQADGFYTLQDGYWWVADPVQHHGPAAAFRRLARTVRSDGAESTIAYDQYALLATGLTDPAGNAVALEFDYHHLALWATVDANGARIEVLYDAFGVAIATTHTAQVLDAAGTPRPYGFAPITSFSLRSPPDLAAVLADPGFHLQGAASAVYYDLEAWSRDGRPTAIVELTAETLLQPGTGQPPPAAVIGLDVSYFDGFRRLAQGKTRVEPGPAVARGADGAVILGPDGRPSMAPASVRWLVSGHVASNRKQQPVRRYEPFFSTLSAYEPEAVLARFGAASEIRYDAAGREVRIDWPNGTFRTVVHAPWSSTEQDENDTVGQSAYKAMRELLPAGDAERRALEKALVHAGTPNVTALDPAGMPIRMLTRAVAPEPDRVVQLRRDGDGVLKEITDPRGFSNVAYEHDMLGRVARTLSADAGEARTLLDAFDNPRLLRDQRGIEVRRQFDKLDRPLTAEVREGAGGWRLVERYTYGEDPGVANAAVRHARGRLVRQDDESGSIEVDRYDPAGLIFEQRQRVLSGYQGKPDWNAPASVALEPEVYRTLVEYDGLGRPLRRRTPDGGRLDYAYLAGGAVQGVTLTTDDGRVTNLGVFGEASYNARGQRTRVRLGNGVEVEHAFDPETFRTRRIRALRPAPGGGAAAVLQDVSYWYDPVGNVVASVDAAQEPPGGSAVISNLGVTSRTDYTYDAFYQLVRAEGRAHSALLEHDDRPHGMATGAFRGSRRAALNDGGAVSRYTQTYTYDASGNLTRIRHVGTQSWTKDLWIAATSNRGLPARDANGVAVPAPETRFDATGNCAYMPHLRRIEWNHRGLIAKAVVVDRAGTGQPDDAEYYAYDASGQRTRKVTERLAGGVLVVTDKLYLDGCEVKRVRQGGTPVLARLTSMIDDEVGRVALVHRWTLDSAGRETGDIAQARVHYTLSNHLGGAVTELAGDGRVISHEEYFPFGGTAFVAGDDAREVALKEYRHSGKERDEATGFYYFGHRYYSSSIGRWLSPDPIGPEGGLNLYAYCFNNPVTLADPDGLDPQPKSRGNPVHYDRYESFVARVPPDQRGAISRDRRTVGVEDKAGSGTFNPNASEAELQRYARQHPGATIFIYDPLYDRLKARGSSDKEAAEFAEALHFGNSYTNDAAVPPTNTLDPGGAKDPPGDKPHSDSPSEDKSAQGEGGTGGGRGEGQAGGTGTQPSDKPPGTGGPGALGGTGPGAGAHGAGTGGGGTGDQAGVGTKGTGPGLGQTGIGKDARTAPGSPGGKGKGEGNAPGGGTRHGQGNRGSPGGVPGGAPGSQPGGVPGGAPGGQPGGIAGGDPAGTAGGVLGGTPDGTLPPDPGNPGLPSNGNDPTGSRSGSLAGDRGGSGPGSGVPGGVRGGSASGTLGGRGSGQAQGGTGDGKSKEAVPETALDKATTIAGYWNLEFSAAEEGGVATGGIPGGFGSHVAGTLGQSLYIGLVVLDVIITAVTLGQSIAAKGGIRAVMKGAMASGRRFAGAIAGLFSRQFWKKLGSRVSGWWARHSIEMAIGKGAIKWFPIHTAWRVGKQALHAGGTKPLYMITMRFRESLGLLAKGEFGQVFRRQIVRPTAEGFFNEATTFVFRVPAIRPDRALIGETKVWSCISANWSAFNRANYYLPNIAAAGGMGYGAYRYFAGPTTPPQPQGAPNAAP